MYAVAKNCHEKGCVSRRACAQMICRDTTASTSHLVNGSGPHSFVTSGCFLMIACRRLRCGSSVYVQKNWVYPPSLTFAGSTDALGAAVSTTVELDISWVARSNDQIIVCLLSQVFGVVKRKQ